MLITPLYGARSGTICMSFVVNASSQWRSPYNRPLPVAVSSCVMERRQRLVGGCSDNSTAKSSAVPLRRLPPASLQFRVRLSIGSVTAMHRAGRGGCSSAGKIDPIKSRHQSGQVGRFQAAGMSRRWRRRAVISPCPGRISAAGRPALDSHFRWRTRARVIGAVILCSLIEIDRLPPPPRRAPVYIRTTQRAADVEPTTTSAVTSLKSTNTAVESGLQELSCPRQSRAERPLVRSSFDV